MNQRNADVRELSVDGEKVLYREALTTRLIDLLDRRGVVLFSSPPMTGKTALAELVCRAVVKRNHSKDVVVSFSVLGGSKNDDFKSLIKENCGVSYDDVLGWASQGSTVYFVVDEAQFLYRKGDADPQKYSTPFWEMVQETFSNPACNIRVLMLATYGAHPDYDLLSIPVDIPQELRLGVEELNFTPDEMKEYVDKLFLGRACLQGDDLEKFQSCLWRLTGGHIGYCVTAIGSLNEKFKSSRRSGSLPPSAETWIRLMEQALKHENHEDDSVFEALNRLIAVREGVKTLDSKEFEVLGRVLDGNVDRSDVVVKKCIRLGILVKTVEGKIEFSSAAMRRFVLTRCIGRIQRAQDRPSTLQVLMLRAFSAINYDNFLFTIREGLSSVDLVESAWIREFYIAVSCCTPSGISVSAADFGANFGSPGCIDFAVQSGDEIWGIELLRQSGDLEERNRCFAADDTYSSLQLSDYCLIDFRLDSAEDRELIAIDLAKYDKLFVVSYDAEMSSVQLRNGASTWNLRGLRFA
ncbi:hypothetical protein PF004_g4874 [Phytophthora fragariae]|uniref:Uncharacterized protein n=1 Tax=Phytophthora fragariae TaxID=53985 RepID=A0A6G0PH94_9STRA|nr:hypothetical protein PF004_g4874 [Phytophthora fragariae]